jgi:hypothetical protein
MKFKRTSDASKRYPLLDPKWNWVSAWFRPSAGTVVFTSSFLKVEWNFSSRDDVLSYLSVIFRKSWMTEPVDFLKKPSTADPNRHHPNLSMQCSNIHRSVKWIACLHLPIFNPSKISIHICRHPHHSRLIPLCTPVLSSTPTSWPVDSMHSSADGGACVVVKEADSGALSTGKGMG